MECNLEINKKRCTCTYEGCPRKGRCCDCLKHHLIDRELPACCFPENVEKTFDRSFEKFAELVEEGKI